MAVDWLAVLQHQTDNALISWRWICAQWLCHVATGTKLFPSCCLKAGSSLQYDISLYAVALRFPLIGPQGSTANSEKRHENKSTCTIALSLCCLHRFDCCRCMATSWPSHTYTVCVSMTVALTRSDKWSVLWPWRRVQEPGAKGSAVKPTRLLWPLLLKAHFTLK